MMMFLKTINHKHSSKGAVTLVQYINLGADQSDFAFFHNIQSGTSEEEIIMDFERNDRFRKSGQTKMVHEVMAFSPKDGDIDNAVLLDICQQYIQMRAPLAIVYAKVHRTEHCHIHFAISGNEVMSSKSCRLEKAEFFRIRKEIEQFQVEKHRLIHSIAQNPSKNREKPFEKTDKQNHKNALIDIVSLAANNARTISDFTDAMEQQGISMYSNKNITNYGVIYQGNKWRLSRLLPKQKYKHMRNLEKLKKSREKQKENQYSQKR